jgi:hypothetical protein
MQVSVNSKMKVFVVSHASGVSCRGFENVYQELSMLASKLKLNISEWLKAEEYGEVEQYQKYQRAIDMARNLGGFKDTWFSAKTPSKVKSVLEQCRKNGTHIRLFYGDQETGRSWMDENDVIGTVGRSTGIMKIPLLVSSGQYGGGAILDASIVKIMDAVTMEVLYQHNKFHLPKLSLVELPSPVNNMTHEVLADGVVHARFSSLLEASQWVSFINGACMSLPEIDQLQF